MAITYRDTKGSNLTPAEADENIRTLVAQDATLQVNIDAKQDDLGFTPVPNSRTINGHALTSDLTLAKSDIALSNVDNTSDASKPVSTAQATADALVLSTAEAYADSLVVGLWDDRGNYNASVNTFPVSGGSGSVGAVKKGDIWTISVAGTLGGTAVIAGDTVRSLQDTPGQTSGNWAISSNGLVSTSFSALSGVYSDNSSLNTKIVAMDSATVAKATDSLVVHLAGTESITGVKTFTLSPIVPTPTTATQASNKTYTDNTAIAMAIALG